MWNVVQNNPTNAVCCCMEDGGRTLEHFSPPDIVNQLLVVVGSASDRALAVGTEANLNKNVIE